MGTASANLQRTIALLAILLGLLVPMLGGLLAPAHAVTEGGSSGNPSDECAGLLYLDKFEWSEGGSGSFAVGTTSGDTDDSDDGYAYSSSTGVTVAYTVDDGGEVHSVSWTSTTPVDRVWEKAGKDTNTSVAYDEATAGTETVSGNAYSHITWCYDEDQPEDPTVDVGGACDTATVTITNPDQVQFSVDVFVDDVYLETITGSTDYVLQPGQTLSVTDGASTTYGTFAWQDCTEPTVALTGECEFATVVITNPAQAQFEVEVFINGVSQGTITETTDYVLTEGDVLTTSETGEESVAWEDCSEPEPASYTATPQCVDGTSQVTVTISDPDGVGGLVTILVDGVEVATTDAGGTWTGDAGQLLQVMSAPAVFATAEVNDVDEVQVLETPRVLAEAVFADCFVPPPPPPPTPTTASFTVGSVCLTNAPTVDYVVDVTEGDDPFGPVTLSVVGADDSVLVEETIGGDASDTLLLPGREGEVVTVRWDFDDSVQQLTLATGCAQVLGVVEEREPAPDPVPDPKPAVKEPVVAAEELPAAGATSDSLLIMGGALLAFGCSLLLAERRTRRVRA